jgi:hypothetical protein
MLDNRLYFVERSEIARNAEGGAATGYTCRSASSEAVIAVSNAETTITPRIEGRKHCTSPVPEQIVLFSSPTSSKHCCQACHSYLSSQYSPWRAHARSPSRPCRATQRPISSSWAAISQPRFAGLNTYANLPYVHCLARGSEEVEKFDIAILGAPFDTVSNAFQ